MIHKFFIYGLVFNFCLLYFFMCVTKIYAQEASVSAIILDDELKQGVSEFIQLTWVFYGVVFMYIGARLGSLLFNR